MGFCPLGTLAESQDAERNLQFPSNFMTNAAYNAVFGNI